MNCPRNYRAYSSGHLMASKDFARAGGFSSRRRARTPFRSSRTYPPPWAPSTASERHNGKSRVSRVSNRSAVAFVPTAVGTELPGAHLRPDGTSADPLLTAACDGSEGHVHRRCLDGWQGMQL